MLWALPPAPPTDVTVTCDDGPAARWQYANDDEVRFLVHVGESWRCCLQDQTTRRAYRNLSVWVWESLDSVMDVHYVSVAAVAPDGRSSANASATFTYNIFKMADITCKLDFPAVDVKAGEADHAGAVVSFLNPLRHYPQLSRATRGGAVSLDFRITFDGQKAADVSASCRPERNVCMADVIFPPDSSQCVTVAGHVSDSAGRSLALRPSARTCLRPPSAQSPLPIALPSILAGALLVCLAVVVAATRKPKVTEALPKCLSKVPLDPPVGRCCPTDGGDSRHKMTVPLISPADDNTSGVSTEMESLPDHLEEGEGEGEGEESGGEMEESESNYDRVHVSREVVDIGDGEKVYCYTER
ncbi:uncharacterized protein LOC144055265 isoform X2 [Vanacampus margaritifer]